MGDGVPASEYDSLGPEITPPLGGTPRRWTNRINALAGFGAED